MGRPVPYLLFLLLLGPLCVAPAPCPRSCACPQPTELHCTFRSLITVPSNINRFVERINLGFNSISKILEKSLSGLSRLELLLMHGNDIHSLPDGAFKDLRALQMLKLSYNKLTEVNRHTFHGLWSLARLHLDHNRLEFIDPDAFHGLTSLRLLQLEGNRLQQIHPSTFTTFTLMDRFHLSTVRHLYLSNNSLSVLPKTLLDKMPQLENLFLHGNPWVCDCNMRWILNWIQTAPGVLKCKKDRVLPGSQLCPMCSSPRNLRQKEFHTLDNMVCSSPVINSDDRPTKPEETDSEGSILDNFRQTFGNISLGLSDEHGNEVELDCGIDEPKELRKINWEQSNEAKMFLNVTLSLDLDCPVDREKYERLWRLIAYYSSVPAHLKRGIMLSKDPHPMYVYKQDSDKDALYYTGVKASIMALPSWLMQTYTDLQLNRQQSSGKKVKLILTTQLSQTLELERVRRQARTWVVIDSTKLIRKTTTVILGKRVELQCNVQSSGEPIITWILPDGSKLDAPSDNPDERLSITADGGLGIKTVDHKDAGNYHCVAKVEEDIAVLSFYLAVQESSNPQPGEDQTSSSPLELFAGNSINLPCNVSGSPDPDVNWILPNGNIVTFRSNTSRAFVFSNGTLHIPQSQLPDNGFYKCVALNQHGIDTKTADINVSRRPGMVKPLRRFSARPQSASGLNTKIKVQIKDVEEGSGDVEEGRDLKPVQRVVPGPKSVHPLRNTWKRPPIMLRRPALQGAEDRSNSLDNRRRVNMSKAKINPEKWADILAKIRIKNGQFYTTAIPILATTPQMATQQTTFEGSSDGATTQEKKSQDFTTTQIHAQENTYSPHMTSLETTLKPFTPQAFFNVQQSTPSDVFFLPQTTSAPLHAVTFWQASPNTVSRSITYSQKESPSTNTDVDGDKPADFKRTKAMGKRKNKARLSVNKSKKDKEGQVVTTVDPITSKRDEKVMEISETIDWPKDILQWEAILTMVSPTTVQTWRKQEQSGMPPRQPNSKRRNGNRRKKPNRRKQKLNKSIESIDTTALSVNQVTAKPTELEIDVLKAMTASLSPNVPFSRSQESTGTHLKSPQTELFKSTSAQWFIPTAFPNAPKTREDMTPSTTQRRFTSRPLPPVKPLDETPLKNTASHSDRSTHGFHSEEHTGHTNAKLIQSHHQYTTPHGRTVLLNEAGEQFSTLSSSTRHNTDEIHPLSVTSGLMTMPGLDFGADEVTRPKTSFKTSAHNPNTKNIEEPIKIAITTALPRISSPNAMPKTYTPPLITKNNAKQATSISIDTENVNQKQHGLPQPIIPSPNDTTQQPPSISISPQNSNQDQKTKNKKVIFSQNSTQQSPSISTSIDNQTMVTSSQNTILKTMGTPNLIMNATQQATNISISLKDNDQKQDNLTKLITAIPITTVTPLPQKDPILQAPSTSISTKNDNKDQNDTRKLLISIQNAIPKTNVSHEATSIRPKNNDQMPDSPTKLRISSHNANAAIAPSLLMDLTQQTPSISASPQSSNKKQNSQSNSMKTPTTSLVLTDTTQQPLQTPPELTDLITQSPNHKLGLFISANPTSPALNIPSGHTIRPTTTLAPNITLILADSPTERPQLRATPKLPASASAPGGKPRITKSNFQTMSVKAETDARLPCAAVGVPVPFLSWTKVSTSASIPQNTRLQRLEVHPNGTLIIRNTQPVDGGEYLCTVQNQYGSDQMLTNLVVLSQHPKILQPRHRDITVNLGSNIDLVCQVEGHPKPRVMWVLPNHAQIAATPFGLASQNRASILSNGTLRIIHAGFSDRGIYKCVGSSAAGADTVSVRLYITALPPVIQQKLNENTTVMENGVVYFHCTASGSPQPTIRWITPDNIHLTSSQFIDGRKLMVFPNGTLYMQGLSKGNAGKYECTASNTMGLSKRTVNLSVNRNPLSAKANIVASSPKNTEMVYGGEIKLDCVAKGEPEPRVIWRTPSKKLVDTQYSFDHRVKVHPNGSLTVRSVTEKDGGDYLCVARNKNGDDYVVLRVDILTRPAKIEHKQQRSDQEVVYGGELKVDCVASGLPNPEISWALPDGTMINPDKQQRDEPSGGRSRGYVVFDNGTLFFNDVGMREEGDYTCYAQNQLGKDEMKVRVKVKAASSPPQIQNKDLKSPVRVYYGETLTLRCNTKGEPAPMFTWISPTNRVISLTKDKYQVSNDGTLVVQKVQRSDAGDYTCKARNSFGQDNKITRVEVLVLPPVISATQGNGNSFKVSSMQNQKLLLDCIAKGSPTPRIMWVLPGNVILPAPYYSNRMSVFENGTLEIRSPKRTDSGQLACIARNEGGEVRLLVNLEVKDAVTRSQATTETVLLTVGNVMTLNCSFNESTLPQDTWVLPNGTPLLSGARSSKFFHRQDGSLIISNPSLAEAGTYRCLGRSKAGVLERTVMLLPGRKPDIVNQYNSPINAMNGETLLLHCVTNGEPLRLTWVLPSGVILNRPQRAGRYSVLQNGTLIIQQVSVYDRGLYVCKATNEYGSAFASVSVIVIAYPPRITNGPPSVTYAKHGVAVQLNCATTGIPNVEVVWETPDKTRLAVSSHPRLFGNKYLHPQGSLIIQNPTQRDAGVYRCTARNAIGVDSKATYLNVF